MNPLFLFCLYFGKGNPVRILSDSGVLCRTTIINNPLSHSVTTEKNNSEPVQNESLASVLFIHFYYTQPIPGDITF